MITTPKLAQIMECSEARVTVWQPPLNRAMELFDIVSPARIAAFLAQIGHESGRLIYVREIWNPVQCPWQAKYEGRADLGNTDPGDGQLFRGRGLIQITGRKNYQICGDALHLPLELHPELLEQHLNAALSAAWFWKYGAGLNLSKKALAALAKYGLGHGVNLNDIADKGDFETITLCVNGGLNGLDDRLALLDRARTALADEETAA